MIQGIKKRLAGHIRSLLAVSVFVIACGSAYAIEPYEVLPIKPVPDIETYNVEDQWYFKVENHEVKFDDWGLIGRYEGNELLIGDSLFFVAASVTYHLANGGSSYRGKIKKGSRVAFVLDKKTREVIQLWYFGTEE